MRSADRAVAAALAFETARDFFLGVRDGHAVEKARIDHPAVAVIGRIGDDEGRRVRVGRAHHGDVAEAVFVDEIEVALVMGRAAEDGAGAVFHQDEIRHVDGQRPGRVEGMDGADAGVEAEFLGLVDGLLRGAGALGSPR